MQEPVGLLLPKPECNMGSQRMLAPFSVQEFQQQPALKEPAQQPHCHSFQFAEAVAEQAVFLLSNRHTLKAGELQRPCHLAYRHHRMILQ